jgi:hypothetical protein
MTTYTKLHDGNWGLRSTDTLQPGATVTVAKKSGDTKIEAVGRIVWQGNGVTLATIARTSPVTTRPYTRRSSGRTAGFRPVRGCSACRQAGTMCARCRFDEFDC